MYKPIIYFGKECTVVCDGRCDKAWGISGRPNIQLSDDEDDIAYLSDDELETAPGPMQTDTLEEGGHAKPSAEPLTDPSLMNKWCARQCERSHIFDGRVHDFSKRVYNMPWRHP